MSTQQRNRILSAAAAAALVATSSSYAVVQDFNQARGADGYTLSNVGGDYSGTFDGQEFQPAPSTPGIQGEFFFVGSGLGQLFDLDAHGVLGQGVTGTANDHGGYLYMDYKGATGGPFYWYGGMGNSAGKFPGIVLVGGNTPPVVPSLTQVLAYADVKAPAGKPFRFYINSPYDGSDHQLSFSGTGTGAWQTVGGALSAATPINGGVVYSNLPYSTPNEMSMTVQFASEMASWDNGQVAGVNAVLRMDNLTFTPASVTWAGTAGGNWSDNANWAALLAGGIPIAPSGRNAVAVFGPSAAPQTVTLDSPVVIPWSSGPGGSGGDVPYQNSFYAGTVRFNSTQSYTLAGTQPLQIDTTAANGIDLAGPSGLIQVLAGSHTISAPVSLRRSTDIDVAGGSTLMVTGAVSVFSENGDPVSLGKLSGGMAVLNNVRVTGSLAVGGGTLKIAQNGGAAGTSHVPGLVSVSAGAKLDLTNNKLVTASAIGTHTGVNYTGVLGLVEQGRNGGVWDGAGITTAMPDATGGSGYTSLGVATGSEARGIGPTDTDVWGGQTVTGSDTLVMYTYGGDANLSGNVDIDDYGQIDFNASTGGVLTGWYNGDFDYNGIQDIDDYGIIDFVVGIQGAPFPTGSGAGSTLAAVPEPASFSVMAFAAGLFARRKRRQ